MNAQELLHKLEKSSPDLLAGAVEFAYQTDLISDADYRIWNARIIEAERQKTNELLARFAA